MSHAFADARVMLRREVKHNLRMPAGIVSSVFMPLMFLLLFVYVFGGSIGVGLPGRYIDYITPGVIFMCISGGASQTTLNAAQDMEEGIIARFRTMPISRVSVLTAHAVANVISTLFSALLILGVALLMGFQPAASFIDWVALLGVIVLYTLMVSWLGIAFGLSSKNVSSANGKSLPLQFLPFISSAFVPPQATSAGVQWFIEYQPFTPMIETLRGLLLGTPMGNSLIVSSVWAVGFALLGYFWSRKLYNRDR